MIEQAQPAAGERLRAAETLLDEALADLALARGSTPGPVCAAALAQAAAELRTFASCCAVETPPAGERDTLRKQLRALVVRVQRLECLLAAAAEFYRGWCAAAPAPSSGYESAGYESAGGLHMPPPALLALRA